MRNWHNLVNTELVVTEFFTFVWWQLFSCILILICFIYGFNIPGQNYSIFSFLSAAFTFLFLSLKLFVYLCCLSVTFILEFSICLSIVDLFFLNFCFRSPVLEEALAFILCHLDCNTLQNFSFNSFEFLWPRLMYRYGCGRAHILQNLLFNNNEKYFQNINITMLRACGCALHLMHTLFNNVSMICGNLEVYDKGLSPWSHQAELSELKSTVKGKVRLVQCF